MLYNFYAPILHNLIPLNTTYDENYCKSSAKKDKIKCAFLLAGDHVADRVR